MSSNDEIKLAHEPAQNRFVARLQDNEAELNYRKEADGTLDYYRTFTPTELRGQGIAGRLVTYALDYALERGSRVRPSCPFVAKLIAREPKYADIAVSTV